MYSYISRYFVNLVIKIYNDMPGMMKLSKVSEMNYQAFTTSLENILGSIWPENFVEVKFTEITMPNGLTQYNALIIWKLPM